MDSSPWCKVPYNRRSFAAENEPSLALDAAAAAAAAEPAESFLGLKAVELFSSQENFLFCPLGGVSSSSSSSFAVLFVAEMLLGMAFAASLRFAPPSWSS